MTGSNHPERAHHRQYQQLADEAAASAAYNSLSAQERRVLALIAAGLDNLAIARRLEINHSTARKHASSIYTKLGVDRYGVPRVMAALLYAKLNAPIRE